MRTHRSGTSRPAFIALTIALAMSACGGSTTSDGGGLALDDFPEAAGKAYCDAAEPCCRDGGVPFDRAACLSNITALYADLVSRPDSFTYDPVLAEECLALLTAQDICGDGTAATSDRCGAVFQGRTKPGEACQTAMECQKPPRGTARCTTGTAGSGSDLCVQLPRAASGEACVWTCANDGAGNKCSSNGPVGNAAHVEGQCHASDGLYCADGTCQPLLARDAPCTDSESCATGYCDATVGKCRPIGAAGDPCSTSAGCEEALYCNQGACSPRLAAGAPCTTSGECAGGASCDAGTCSEGFPDLGLALMCGGP